jgi:glycine cleavage system H protein
MNASPQIRRYTEDHFWVAIDDDGTATVGVSEYAQDQLGDVVYVELPDVGRDLEQGEEAVVIESVKTTGEVRSPIAGRVIEVNETLTEEPALVNASCLEDGWLYKLEPADETQFEDLMDAADYDDFVASLG